MLIFDFHFRGAVSALMVIALVRVQIDEVRTRKICLKALMNLISVPKNVMTMLKEGLLWALTSLSQLDDEESMAICATAFCNLSSKTESRLQLTNVKGSGGAGTVLRFILDLTRAESMATKLLCVQALVNMLSEEENATMLLQNHVLERMKPLALLESASNDIQTAAMKIIGKVSCHDKICRGKALDMKAVTLFVDQCFSENCSAQESALISLFHLTWHEDSAVEVVHRNAERTLLQYRVGQKVEITPERADDDASSSSVLSSARSQFRTLNGTRDPRHRYQVVRDMGDGRYKIMSCQCSTQVMMVHRSALRVPIDQLASQQHVLTDGLHHIIQKSLEPSSSISIGKAGGPMELWKMCHISCTMSRAVKTTWHCCVSRNISFQQ